MLGDRTYTLSANSGTLNVIATSGNVAYTISVTDSYGQAGTLSRTVTVLAYTPPTLRDVAIRNTLKYVSDKDRKAFANDLKTIYNAPSEQEGREALDEVTEKWREKYPRAMKRGYDNWDAVNPIYKFSKDVRTVIYTTNAIESLNSCHCVHDGSWTPLL